MATNNVSNLVAAQLSDAAYTPLSTYKAGGIPPQGLPADWSPLGAPPYSAIDSSGTNQFITYVNATGPTVQVMMVFKGTDNTPNGVSDIANSGGSAWDSIRVQAQAALVAIQNTYPNAEIMTDGHSLGGGMAQSFALANGNPPSN